MTNKKTLKKKTMTIVFFDICNYSNMDLNTQIQSVKTIEKGIKKHIIHLNKHAIVEGGDSFAINFDNTDEAFCFVISFMKYLKSQKNIFSVRTGIYTGEALIEKTINNINNIYGIAIDYASRLATCCEPNQILISKHSLDKVVSKNCDIKKYVSGEGVYNIKHNIQEPMYNIYSVSDGFGIPELPLKNKYDEIPFLIIIGDRRETIPKTVGDLFISAPSIDDLCHFFEFDWPKNVLLRGDKIIAWSINEPNSLVSQRNIIVIGSPKVNIGSLLVNENSIFKFYIDNNKFIDEIATYYKEFNNAQPNDCDFIERFNDQKINFSKKITTNTIIDPIGNDKYFSGENETYGIISLAPHPNNINGKYTIYIAGIDLCATLTITGNFFKIDFSSHPYGGVIRIEKKKSKIWKWYDDPHHGELDLKDEKYWMTPSYNKEVILNKLSEKQKADFDKIFNQNPGLSFENIQKLLKRK